MSQPFLGQIQPFGFNFAPRGWAECNGQLVGISQNAALFALLGTMYGGNGTSNFALPNLQSRVPMHFGASPSGQFYAQGEQAGEEQVALSIAELPMHNHSFIGTNQNANSIEPEAGAALATVVNIHGATADNYYGSGTLQPLNPASLATAGGNQPHSNIQPYLTINWCIAMSGIFPTRG